MTLVANGHSIFYIILVTFIASCIFVPLSIKLSYYIGALDIPNDRKIHKTPKPTLGGLAIFLSFMVGYMLFAQKSPVMMSVLIGSFIIILLGFVDDLKPLKARYKLIGQIIVAGIITFYGNLQLTNISAFGVHLDFGIFAPILTILFIVAIINAINLIDGLDGLAAGVSTIYFLTISIIAIILNKFGGLDIVLSLIMAGATLGFLIYNFPPAKIFMGDTGSMFLGLIIAVIALIGFKNVTLTSLIIPLLILAIPILDTLFAIIRRRLKGESIGTADKEHLHHQLLKLKFSPMKSLLIIYGINILFSIASIYYAIGNNSKLIIIIYIVLTIILLFIVLKTNIIFDKNNKHSKQKKIVKN